jgi:formate hydrogenlyase subunit 3/multisubunit Na+/H+ antiporter MnhD subunit
MLRSQQLGRLAGYSIITSSGTVIAATGLDHPALTAGALFYLGSSTLGAATLFLLASWWSGDARPKSIRRCPTWAAACGSSARPLAPT